MGMPFMKSGFLYGKIKEDHKKRGSESSLFFYAQD